MNVKNNYKGFIKINDFEIKRLNLNQIKKNNVLYFNDIVNKLLNYKNFQLEKKII